MQQYGEAAAAIVNRVPGSAELAAGIAAQPPDEAGRRAQEALIAKGAKQYELHYGTPSVLNPPVTPYDHPIIWLNQVLGGMKKPATPIDTDRNMQHIANLSYVAQEGAAGIPNVTPETQKFLDEKAGATPWDTIIGAQQSIGSVARKLGGEFELAAGFVTWPISFFNDIATALAGPTTVDAKKQAYLQTSSENTIDRMYAAGSAIGTLALMGGGVAAVLTWKRWSRRSTAASTP